MIVRKILAVLVIVAGIYPAYTKHVSLWDEQVFPDDISWSETSENLKLDYSMENEAYAEDSAENEVDTKNYEVCETQDCKIIAKEFLSSMNQSVDPCNDFYEFTCGAWAEKNPIPLYEVSWSRMMMFDDAVRYRIKGFLETKPDPSDILPVRQAKKWYRSCMDGENLKRRGIIPIESILIQTGGWPITMDDGEWDAQVYTWQTVERHFARLTGNYTLYTVGYSSRKTIKITPPILPISDELPPEHRTGTNKIDYDVYLRLVEDAASVFVQQNRANVSKERISKEAKEIVEFEKEIYELQQGEELVSRTLENFYDLYDNMTGLNGDSKEKIVWKSVIEELFDMANIKLNSSIRVYSRKFQYIRGIENLLRKTPARTIVNYIHWNFVSKMIPYTREKTSWLECLDDVKMKHATAYGFVEKYFPKSTENAARKMIKNIQNALDNEIMQSNWLDEKSKKWAREKLSNMKMYIGYPEWYKNKTAVINYYKDLTIGAEYFDNTLSFMRYMVIKELKTIYDLPRIRDQWTRINPITVNGAYNRRANTLGVPAANFQAPFFTPQFPENVNYGIIGAAAGHEMGHGFDDVGFFYDYYNTKGIEYSKLPKDVSNEFHRLTDCFVDQFEGYFKDYFEERTIKLIHRGKSQKNREKIRMGLKTINENIADSTGLQASFEAYKKMKIMSSSVERRLPGLEEYTDDQVFFISFGAGWCQANTPKYDTKEEDARDSHSPYKFRVIGTVSNTKNFAKAFNCPIGSPMNPQNKCNIWEKP